MKQMKECLDRVFASKPPLKHKLRAEIDSFEGVKCLIVGHYQHVLLIYDLEKNMIEYEWWELPTDKRCLEAAKEYLKERALNESNRAI